MKLVLYFLILKTTTSFISNFSGKFREKNACDLTESENRYKQSFKKSQKAPCQNLFNCVNSPKDNADCFSNFQKELKSSCSETPSLFCNIFSNQMYKSMTNNINYISVSLQNAQKVKLCAPDTTGCININSSNTTVLSDTGDNLIYSLIYLGEEDGSKMFAFKSSTLENKCLAYTYGANCPCDNDLEGDVCTDECIANTDCRFFCNSCVFDDDQCTCDICDRKCVIGGDCGGCESCGNPKDLEVIGCGGEPEEWMVRVESGDLVFSFESCENKNRCITYSGDLSVFVDTCDLFPENILFEVLNAETGDKIDLIAFAEYLDGI